MLADETNLIREALEADETDKFKHYLHQHRDEIRQILAHHFGLRSKEDCVVSSTQEWITGGFNTSIPVDIPPLQKRLMFRCPNAHKLGESTYPGNVNEKSRGEIGTQIWIQQTCRKVPTARLHGFQFPDGRHFTHERRVFSPRRFLLRLRQLLCKHLKWPIPSEFLATNCTVGLRTGYIIMDFVDGQPLSSKLWSTLCNNDTSRHNLFRGVSEILLDFARTPLPRIGSWRFNDDGTISLTSRPLSCALMVQENEGAKRVIEPGTTYSNLEPYISDILSCHYNWLIAEPNAVNDAKDCRRQLGAGTILRSIFTSFFDTSSRNGPFIMTPTDCNQYNLHVDEHGKVKALLDLEFYCALPIQMCFQLRWLSPRSIDAITNTSLDDFNKTLSLFFDVLRETETEYRKTEPSLILLTDVFENGWATGRFWYSAAAMSVNAIYSLFHQHISEKFGTRRPQKMYDYFAEFSSMHSEEVVAKKVTDKDDYERRKALLGDTRVKLD